MGNYLKTAPCAGGISTVAVYTNPTSSGNMNHMEEQEMSRPLPDEQAPCKEAWHAPLMRPTHLSKYLAMVLFVALPFVGFYLGTQFSIDKSKITTTVKMESIEETKPENVLIDNHRNNTDLQLVVLSNFENPLENYFKDKNGVYVYKPDENSSYEVNVNYDLTNGMCDSIDPSCPFQRLEADVDSFEVIGLLVYQGGTKYPFAKDKNSVFRHGEKIKNVNANNFQFIFVKEPYSDGEINLPLYAKNSDSVFSLFTINDNLLGEDSWPILEGADPNTFSVSERGSITSHSCRYAKDKNRVYLCEILLKDADSKSFQFLGVSIAKDSKNIYYDQEIIDDKNIDINSFVYTGWDEEQRLHIFEDKNYKFDCDRECKIIEIK